jgi:hypothetical protein
MLVNKVTLEIEEKPAELYPLRRGMATTDLIFGVRQLIEGNWEYEKEVVMIFIDFKKVFGSMRSEEI